MTAITGPGRSTSDIPSFPSTSIDNNFFDTHVLPKLIKLVECDRVDITQIDRITKELDQTIKGNVYSKLFTLNIELKNLRTRAQILNPEEWATFRLTINASTDLVRCTECLEDLNDTPTLDKIPIPGSSILFSSTAPIDSPPVAAVPSYLHSSVTHNPFEVRASDDSIFSQKSFSSSTSTMAVMERINRTRAQLQTKLPLPEKEVESTILSAVNNHKALEKFYAQSLMTHSDKILKPLLIIPSLISRLRTTEERGEAVLTYMTIMFTYEGLKYYTFNYTFNSEKYFHPYFLNFIEQIGKIDPLIFSGHSLDALINYGVFYDTNLFPHLPTITFDQMQECISSYINSHDQDEEVYNDVFYLISFIYSSELDDKDKNKALAVLVNNILKPVKNVVRAKNLAREFCRALEEVALVGNNNKDGEDDCLPCKCELAECYGLFAIRFAELGEHNEALDAYSQLFKIPGFDELKASTKEAIDKLRPPEITAPNPIALGPMREMCR